MRKRRKLLQRIGCILLAGTVLCVGAPGTVQAEEQNEAVQQPGYASAFAAQMPAQYQPTAANLLYCIDHFDEAKAQYDEIGRSSIQYWKAVNGMLYGGGPSPLENQLYLYDSTYSPDPEKQYLKHMDKRKSIIGTIPRNLYYTEQYAPLLEAVSPDGYTFHGSVLQYRIPGQANSWNDYVATPGIGQPLSGIEVTYYARTADEWNAASKEKGAAYMERLFREINWTQIVFVQIAHRDIPQRDGSVERLTDVKIHGFASPEYPLIQIDIDWQVDSGRIQVSISDDNY